MIRGITVTSRNTSRRLFSTAEVSTESPRVAIAKSMLLYEAVAKATSEAELLAVTKMTPKVDITSLPPSIAHLKEYLSVSPAASSKGYVKDPNAWQNMEISSYIATEAGRGETWPFLVGAVVTYLLFGVGIPAMLPNDAKKNSKYISFLEGRHGKLDNHHESAGAHAH